MKKYANIGYLLNVFNKYNQSHLLKLFNKCNSFYNEGDDCMKTEKEKMVAGEMYMPDDEGLVADRIEAKRLTRLYNEAMETGDELRFTLLNQLLGSSADGISHIKPTFRCDYGYNIHIGKNFFSNFNCVILDVCEVRIGDNCMFAPGVHIYTATHPLQAAERNSGKEYGKPVKIGNNVWVGGERLLTLVFQLEIML